MNNTLGSQVDSKVIFTSPILDQGSSNTCTRFESCGSRSAVTGRIYDTDAYGRAEGQYLDQSDPQGVDMQTAMNVGVDPGWTIKGQSIPTDTCAAILWLYAGSKYDLYDTIQNAIVQYQRPVDAGLEWYLDWESGTYGICPATANTPLGPHCTMYNGKVTRPINPEAPAFPESDRMANQGSWGILGPGSDAGFYYHTRAMINQYGAPYGCCVRIDSSDNVVKILGKLSAKYVQLIDLLRL